MNEMQSIKDKVVLVTGTSSGIGKATAIAFSKHGAKLVLSDRDSDSGTEQIIKDHGGEAIFVSCDVSDEQQVIHLVEQSVAKYGRLDCAFNNAGIPGLSQPVAECTAENWSTTLGINLDGVWYCMKYQIQAMLKTGGGVIINNASVAGLVGFSGANPAYIASKHAVVGLTKSAALDYATQGIRVNAVCPGIIKTAIIDNLAAANPEVIEQLTFATPMARLGRPEEIAETVVFLASDSASFITGQAITVDGGWVAR